MAIFNIQSIAIKWYFFCSSSLTVYNEFCHILMKQLGLNAQQIGFTNFFGVQHMLIPFILLLGDKFRARSFVIWSVSLLSVINCALPILPYAVSLPTCFVTESNNSSKITAFLCISGGCIKGVLA